MPRKFFPAAMFGLLLLAPLTVYAQTSPPAPPADAPTVGQILARLHAREVERLAALERYETDRTYRLDYTGAGGQHQAELRVHAVYLAPGEKHLTVVSSSGSAFLCEKVLRRLVTSEEEAAASQDSRARIQLTEQNFTIQLIGQDTLVTSTSAEPAWLLHVTPRVESKFAYTGTVWISQRDYAIIRIQGELPRSPSWWLGHSTFDYRYTRHGELWLPYRNISSSHVRLGGQATVTVDYGTYPVVVSAPIGAAVQLAAAR